MKPDIADLLRSSGGVLRRADHPDLRHRLDRLRRTGELTSPLPGILVAPTSDDAELKRDVTAGWLWAGADAVLTGAAAAALTYWPRARVDTVLFATPHRRCEVRGRFQIERRAVPPELTDHLGRIPITTPAMTAVELAAETPDAIDEALRSGITLDQLWAALRATPDRPGNTVRAAVLRDSRDRPWSTGERRLHRLLRQHRITGWRTNRAIRLPSGKWHAADLLFAAERIIVEFDGYAYHSDRQAFDNDRQRRNELELAGYLVLNFTWTHLIGRPEWILSCIRRALAQRG